MNAVERVHEYNNMDQEAPLVIDNYRPTPEWPAVGALEVSNLNMRYRPGLDLVLKDLNFKIAGGEKIGICGRTGSGKSSLMIALFRLVEPVEGSEVQIDGMKASELGLNDLRSRLSIIPQDPVIFSGTVRYNLDPLDLYDDDTIWLALERVMLKDAIVAMGGLSSQVAEFGENFSVGQRQLICLGRALLRDSRVIMLDESTAAVDVETDHLIQSTIRTAFADRTVLTIAHRLNTIIDSDRVMVLGDGNILEFDTPGRLLENQEGVFTSLVNETGAASAKHLGAIARGEIDFFSDIPKSSSQESLIKAEADLEVVEEESKKEL
eukprot:TRINITY_DN6661_c0_g1_i1.p1 TRINITY_DN6661_c0_g1~~TRINITY_DN6661_c0_g1_i1.p1  ORF type:complete len:329 (-),score=88.53 TRINITY_DN6661_c0_g1_i1:3-968(-)